MARPSSRLAIRRIKIMIVQEFYKTRFDGVNLYRTYSDSNHFIRQIETGEIYSDAIDVEGATYTYEETDVLIEPEIEAYDYKSGYPQQLDFEKMIRHGNEEN